MSFRAERIVLPVLAALALLTFWSVAVRVSHTSVFPTPTAVLAGAVDLARSGELLRYVGISLARVLIAYGAAVLVGIPVGIAMGRIPPLATALNPVVQVLRPISPLAWIPVSILLFGIGNLAIGFLIFLASVFPVILSAYSAVSGIPVIYLRAGANFGLTPLQRFFRVLLPALLPELLNGVRLGLGVAWLVVVSAEMIAADSGLGYLIIDARNAGKRYDLVIAGMILIGVIGLGLDVALRRVERLDAVRWGFRREGGER